MNSLFSSKVFIAVLMLSVNHFVLSGQNLVATYTETRQTTEKIPDEDPKIREAIKNAGIHTKELICSGGISIYKEKQKEMEDSPEHMVVIRIGDDDRGSVYKNLKTKNLVKQQEFFGRSFIIRENLQPITWKVGTEQKLIGSYSCRKATAMLDTVEVVAWFCTDIAINDGPDIFWGLPGLILEVELDKGKRRIVANSVKITREAQTIEIPQRGKEVTQAEYNAIKKEKMSEMRRANPAGAPNKVEIRVVH